MTSFKGGHLGGHPYSIVPSLSRHDQWLASPSLKAAVESLRLPLALETLYRLRRQLRERLDRLRSRLCRERPPPASTQADPLRQTVEHLQKVFPDSACPLAAFQLHFQQPFLG